MKTTYILKWIVGLTMFGVLVFVGALYLLASRVPSGYRPEMLDSRQRVDVAKRFAKKTLEEFGNQAQSPEPFSMVFTEREINEYLASLDEIAAQAPDGKPGEVTRLMGKAGISQPMISIRDEGFILMTRLEEHQKILSIDLDVDTDDQNRLCITLTGARLGELPVPLSMVEGRLDGLQQSLSRRVRNVEYGQGLTMEHIGAGAAQLAGSIGNEPISLDLPIRVNGRGVRVMNLGISQGKVVVAFQPHEIDE